MIDLWVIYKRQITFKGRDPAWCQSTSLILDMWLFRGWLQHGFGALYGL